jgi:ABC-type multidrug transport system fused ATPase/permease subunit
LNSDEGAVLESELIRALSSPVSVNSLGIVSSVIGQYKVAAAAHASFALGGIQKRAMIVSAIQFVAVAYWSFIFWFATYIVVSDTCSVTNVFQALTTFIFASIRAGTMSIQIPPLGSASKYARKFHTILTGSPLQSVQTLRTKPPLSGQIEFKDVSFEYPARRNFLVLKKVSFVIPAGATVAFVGPSGCGLLCTSGWLVDPHFSVGKSTILALIQKLYDPISGQIFIDNHPLAEIDVDYYRQNLAVMAQESRLFNDSLMNNILYGIVNDDEDEEVRCCLSRIRSYPQ